MTARILAGCVVAFLLATLLVSAIPGLSRVVHLTVGLLMMAVLVRLLDQPLRLRLDAPLAMFWAFFVFAGASILWSPVQNVAIVRTVSLAIDITGASLVLIALWNGVSMRVVGTAVAVGALLQAGIGLVQYYSGDLVRAEGLTGNANALAIQLSLAAFILLLSFPESRWPHVVVWALISIATIVSGSRKIVFVWFAYGLVAVNSMGLVFRKSRVLAGMFLLLLPLMFGAWLLLGPDASSALRELVVVGRIERALGGEDTSFITRSAMVRDALELWSSSPIWGHGIDQFRQLSEFGTYSHNNYTELLTSFGVVGFALYYGIIALLLARAIAAAVGGARVGWIAIALITLILLMGVASVSYTSRLHWILLAVMTHALFQDAADGDAPHLSRSYDG